MFVHDQSLLLISVHFESSEKPLSLPFWIDLCAVSLVLTVIFLPLFYDPYDETKNFELHFHWVRRQGYMGIRYPLSRGDTRFEEESASNG